MEVINPKKRFAKGGGLLGLFAIIFLVATFASSFWVIVDAGQTGVQSLFGKVRDAELSSGFHLKNPFVRITKMPIRTQEYTMSKARGEGDRFGDDAITELNKEGLSVDLDITVLFHIEEEKASDIYRDIGLGYREVIIRPAIRSIIREAIAQYDAKDIYSDKREEATQKIFERIQETFTTRGIEVEEVLVRNVELPTDLAASIEQKLQAEQEAARYDFVLER